MAGVAKPDEFDLEAILAEYPDEPLTAEGSARLAREYGVMISASVSAPTPTTMSGVKRKPEPATAFVFKAPNGKEYEIMPPRAVLTGESGKRYPGSLLRYEVKPKKDEPSRRTGPT